MSAELNAKRKETRNSAKAARKSIGHIKARSAALAVRDTLLKLPEYTAAQCVMVYLSALGELPTRPIVEKLLQDGKTVTVPYTDMDTRTITPCIFEGYSKTVTGAYGILSPARLIPVAPESIDAVIVPGIAFDTKGGRLGFGAGYYDRFLPRVNAVKIGICYECQIVDETYQEEHDVPMDFIVTERRLIRCGKIV